MTDPARSASAPPPRGCAVVLTIIVGLYLVAQGLYFMMSGGRTGVEWGLGGLGLAAALLIFGLRGGGAGGFPSD